MKEGSFTTAAPSGSPDSALAPSAAHFASTLLLDEPCNSDSRCVTEGEMAATAKSIAIMPELSPQVESLLYGPQPGGTISQDKFLASNVRHSHSVTAHLLDDAPVS
ncbi:unnamed protein product [Protopolystoma xenopodis]|uniref:Uncharacterized protein n=1 Tax=Protopolystoma xenopodis TaxID=117903 RepID=A0A448XNW8_9PLAT|nr:unnamed protein product [Protopolystoma xenopodis]